jgi:hypothetical protein
LFKRKDYKKAVVTLNGSEFVYPDIATLEKQGQELREKKA